MYYYNAAQVHNIKIISTTHHSTYILHVQNPNNFIHRIACNLRKKGTLTIQDFDLHIPEVIHRITKRRTFRWNTAISRLCAVKIDAVK